MQQRTRTAVVVITVLLLMAALSQSAEASNYWLGRYWTGPHTRVEVVGLHNSYAGPAVGYRNHINFNVWSTTRAYQISRDDRRVANLHISFTQDGCLYIWDSQTGYESMRCVNWNSWNSLYSSISDAINSSVHDVSGSSIQSTWMLWLVAALFLPFLFA